MRIRDFAASMCALYLSALPAFADETCFDRAGQFANMRHCVTSVRAPVGDTKFGPDNLAATGDGAWCTGAERNQKITMY